MATNKLSAISTKGTPPSNLSQYSYWGNRADDASKQGWYPAVPNPKEGYTVYRQNYNAPFNTVLIPGTKEMGRLEVIGKKGNKMDIVISDNQGNVRHTINSDVSPDFVQNYMANQSSTIQQRVNGIANNQVNSNVAMNR